MLINTTTAYDTALAIYAMTPPAMLFTLFRIDAPYGRFSRKFIIDCSYSGKWSWFIMEVMSPITFISTIYTNQLNPYQYMLTLCWMIHYLHRSILYPLCAHSMAPIHLFASVSAILFNVLNGYTNAYFIGNHLEVNSCRRFVLGFVVWMVGFISNVYHDRLLFQLRCKKKGYSIPYGGLFQYVSCPNYFSEVVEWSGFAMAAYPSMPACIFVLATMANLLPRAWRTHCWYKREFKAYPVARKAVVPFVF
ncbi:hypothetical protein K501DRAFT_246529 [Backusella circina FSU 941]|nr:hypothetical protein K501DRAFT_246529 [Backusella circina FSU 941]